MTKACNESCAATKKCWACGTSLHIPAFEFKCGWCGALTNSCMSDRAGSSDHRLLQQTGQHLFVAIVAAFIFADAIISIHWLLPIVCSGIDLRLQQIAGVYTAAVVVSKFSVSVLCSPGHPHSYIEIGVPGQTVLSGQYDNFAWCQQCKYAKPPEAHHCRKCGRCIMDMDHHCFFLNNCVGRNNLKPFLLFLAWLLLGALYIMGTVSYLLYQRWDEVSSHTGVPKFGYGLVLWSMRLYWNIVFAPGWLQTSAFLLSTATGAVLAVGGLLKAQLSLLMTGKTYIDSLQHSSSPALQQQCLSCPQLQQAFVRNVSWSWLCPIWRTEERSRGSKWM